MEKRAESWRAFGLPAGDYHLIGWDVDTTGSGFDDEICHIAAYTPTASFARFVIPYQDIKPAARRKHGLNVVTVGRFRMLKDTKTNSVLKTKCLVAALAEFLQWLEGLKAKTSDGVILIFHEARKVSVPILLQAVRKYNFMEKFTAVVKGFVNGYSVAEVMCTNHICSVSLKTLSKTLLHEDDNLGSAAVRARLAFQILQIICGNEPKQGRGDGSQNANTALVQAISRFTKTIAQEEEELERFKNALDRQAARRGFFATSS
ncbi:hypothetical protein R5R35_005480 [Gryllus longicercus]|uniref:Exuperantia RNAse H-like domain-containing protein n=1 Tax=Gryllus longicercus TaxID=2509291 RepID=A0AAN9ZBK6_9ORTH